MGGWEERVAEEEAAEGVEGGSHFLEVAIDLELVGRFLRKRRSGWCRAGG